MHLEAVETRTEVRGSSLRNRIAYAFFVGSLLIPSAACAKQVQDLKNDVNRNHEGCKPQATNAPEGAQDASTDGCTAASVIKDGVKNGIDKGKQLINGVTSTEP